VTHGATPTRRRKEIAGVKLAKIETFFLRYRYPSHVAYRFAADLVETSTPPASG
jgi:hypothetical protein